MMPIDVQIPPFHIPEEEWRALSICERALLMAGQECDVYHTQEIPKYSNRGPRVDEMLRVAHCGPGNPWCAAFVTWCLLKSCWDPFSDVPGQGVMYPASVVSWVAWAKRSGRHRSAPARGHLGYFDKPGETHIFWISHVLWGLEEVETIEGNTNTDGSRDGWEVARRHRMTHSPTGYIDLEGLKARS